MLALKIFFTLLFAAVFLVGIAGFPLYKFFTGEYSIKAAISFIEMNLIIMCIALIVVGVFFYLCRPSFRSNKNN